MACSPENLPHLASDHIDWPIGHTQHVVLYGGEVLHIVHGVEESKGIYFNHDVAFAVAEALVERLTQEQEAVAA